MGYELELLDRFAKDNGLHLRPVVVRARLVATPSELGGAQVHLPQTSPYRHRLLELNDELTQDIEVVEVDAPATSSFSSFPRATSRSPWPRRTWPR